ncbi:ELWxxDGT repeat protein [Runella sp.]|uniref:ELWxxDGT repeat protein n=1 Tax=Runella sp. TaxID=1960881 RepID=UPI003D0FF504
MKQFYTTLLLLCFFFPSHAQQLLKDVYSSNGSTLDFAYSVTIGNAVYFTASSNSYRENNLYKTDGTAVGTLLLNTTNTGSKFRAINSLLSFNGKAVFKAVDNTSGYYALFITDGTVAGTVKLINLPSNYDIYACCILNNVLFFRDYNTNMGEELWRTDGTVAGTYFFKDVNPGSVDSVPYYFTVVGNVAYFRAFTNSSGFELWKTDGTPEGTIQVKDIYSGSSGSELENFTLMNGTLYFTATDGVNGIELWKTDGTAAGTMIVKDIYTGSSNSSPSYLKTLGNKLVFMANDIYGRRIWSSDGTSAGTKVINNSLYFLPYYTYVWEILNNNIIFCASDGSNGVELWTSDGTESGTTLLKNINSGSGSYSNQTFNQEPNFTVVGNNLFFLANDGIHGGELWKTDGTTAGTTLVKDINNSPANSDYEFLSFEGVGTKAVFMARSSENDKNEMWISDGSEADTVKVKDIQPNLEIELARSVSFSLGSTIFFSAYHPVTGHELYKTDGTAVNTSLVKDITQTSGSSLGEENRFVHFNNLTFFTANDGRVGGELWVTENTGESTSLYYDFTQSRFDAGIYELGSTYFSTLFNNFTVFNNELYWTTNGSYLWKTNGLTAPAKVFYTNGSTNGKAIFGQLNNELYFLTGLKLYRGNGNPNDIKSSFSLVKDLLSLPFWDNYVSDSVARMIPYNGQLYFVANGYNNAGYELWRTDGTTAGTVMVKDIYAGSSSSNPFGLTVYNGKLYFIATNGINGYELWQSDGTSAGTSMVIDLNPGYNNGFLTSPLSSDKYGVLVAFNNKLFFRADNGTSGHELWQSDGTAAGTSMVKNIMTGSNHSYPNGLVTNKNRLYFSAYTPLKNQLYSSDGTESGTQLIKPEVEINSSLLKGDSSIYFRGSNFDVSSNATPKYYYRSDGTSAGTVRITNSDSTVNTTYNPVIMSYYNGKLYFSVWHSRIGREPWILRPDCPDEYSFSNPGETTPSGSSYRFKAAKRIEAFNTLQTNSNVVYQAANSLELKPGFSVSNGAMFKAQIGGCDTDINALSSRTAVKDLKKLLTTPAVSATEEKEPMQLPLMEEFLQQPGGEEIRHLIERQRIAKASYESLPMAERISRNPVTEPNVTIEYVRTEGQEKVFRMRVQLNEQLRALELRKRM